MRRKFQLQAGGHGELIQLRAGLSTEKVAQFLRGRRQLIAVFADSTADSLLVLTKG